MSFSRNKEHIANIEANFEDDEENYRINSNSVKVDLSFVINEADRKVFIKPKDKQTKHLLLHPAVTADMLAVKLEDYIISESHDLKREIFQNFKRKSEDCSCRLLSMITLKSGSDEAFTIYCNGKTVINRATERSNQMTQSVFSTVEVQFDDRVFDARVLGILQLTDQRYQTEFIFLIVFCMDKIRSSSQRVDEQKYIHDEVYQYIDLANGKKNEMDIQIIDPACVIGPTCMIPLYRSNPSINPEPSITELLCHDEKFNDFTTRTHKKYWTFLKINIPMKYSKAARWADKVSRIHALDKVDFEKRKHSTDESIPFRAQMFKYVLGHEDLEIVDDFQQAYVKSGDMTTNKSHDVLQKNKTQACRNLNDEVQDDEVQDEDELLASEDESDDDDDDDDDI
jgi:hypothetical protein